jgi:hypothetical protein
VLCCRVFILYKLPEVAQPCSVLWRRGATCSLALGTEWAQGSLHRHELLRESHAQLRCPQQGPGDEGPSLADAAQSCQPGPFAFLLPGYRDCASKKEATLQGPRAATHAARQSAGGHKAGADHPGLRRLLCLPGDMGSSLAANHGNS